MYNILINKGIENLKCVRFTENTGLEYVREYVREY
nr:MAG TPA: hypothetical protein [Caudoviricetes sp.]